MFTKYLYERAFKSDKGISGAGCCKFAAEAVSPAEVRSLLCSSVGCSQQRTGLLPGLREQRLVTEVLVLVSEVS